MSTITVEMTLTYRGQPYTQCEQFNLDKIVVRSLYDRTVQAHINVMLDEVVRRYDIFDLDEVKIATEIIDLDEIPEEYVVDGKLTDEFWRINQARWKADVKVPEKAYYAGVKLGIPLDKICLRYEGSWDSDEEFAYDTAESMGLNPIAWPLSALDWGKAGRALMMDYRKQDDCYFNSNC